MKISLENKNVLVTGGSQGIGEAIALAAAQAGANVAITYYREQALAEKVVSNIQKLGVKAIAIQLDLSEQSSIDQCLNEAVAFLEQIDVLINNGAALIREPFFSTSSESLDRLYKSNLRGTFSLTQSVLSHMLQRGIKGNIVNLSSERDTTISRDLAAYQMMKAALLMLTKVVALNVAQYGIRCNAVAPGMIKTAMQNHSPALFRTRELKVPLGRAGEAQEVANAVIFLASDLASYVTGVRFLVDGGRTLGMASTDDKNSLPPILKAKL